MLKRRLHIILTLLVFGTGHSFAQSSDSIISDIRTKYKHIHDNIQSYDTTMIDIWDESTEGGQGTAYYDGNNLRLIETIWFGETGKRKIEYYFDNGQLFFAFDADFEYNRPIYWDEKKAKEFNDSITFDPNKTIVKEDRYYFYNEKLIRWLDNDKKEIDLLLGTNSIVGQGLIAHAYKMKDKLKK